MWSDLSSDLRPSVKAMRQKIHLLYLFLSLSTALEVYISCVMSVSSNLVGDIGVIKKEMK